MKKLLFVVIILIALNVQAQKPIRLAIAGLSHGHVGWVFNRADKHDTQLVGIYETNPVLVERFIKQHKLDRALFFNNLEDMLEKTKPDAVSAFGPINEHITVVRACAPRKIHVMVEKPLATTYKDALEIETLAKVNNIQVLTNFETSWYASNQYLGKLYVDGKLGNIRKVMVNDGHEGPKEIGVSTEFFDFLTDPIKNGAGALNDFGCYGANLMTWLMQGEKPLTVTAVVNQNKPEIYPKVDDEATIILQYPKAQCVIQASWNWTFSRKDMEIYGDKGYAIAVNPTTIRQRLSVKQSEETIKIDPRPAPFTDPFSVLAQVINGELKLEKFDLYGLPVNVTVVQILELAKRSAETGKTISLK